EAGAYLQEMERRGLVDKTAVTPQLLADEVRRADDELVAGQNTVAAARLYAIVEGPRYQDFSDTEDFQDAEYRLGLALARGGRVSPKSRFYSSALYLRGVMRVKRQDLRGAEDAFCAIADVKAGDRIRFYIDGRYYALKDLARLALGRIAHEEGRDDDAFYHYF